MNDDEATVRFLVETPGDVMNAWGLGGYHPNAHLIAAGNEHETIVRFPVENNADVNTQRGVLGNALQAAIANGYKVIFRFLTESVANMKAGEICCSPQQGVAISRLYSF